MPTKKPIENNIQLITLFEEISADLETPISVYLKLKGIYPSFLLESVEGGERLARYSFIGIRPSSQYIIRGQKIQTIKNGSSTFYDFPQNDDPTQFLQNLMSSIICQPVSGLPRFIGGLVGYLGFESVRFFEPSLASHVNHSELPDAVYMMADTIIAFDHARGSLFLIINVAENEIESGKQKLKEIKNRLQSPIAQVPFKPQKTSSTKSNNSREDFENIVNRAKEYIFSGDIFQVVLSQRFYRKTVVDAFEVYRAVRRLNPSPYMYFFDFGEINSQPLFVVGASPEMFVRLEGRTAALNPIAGTARRDPDPVVDARISEDLLNDPKERAEHVMLVDLGRNDLGRVCEYGSIKVPEFLTIEKYSHVMHIVSHVEGTLRPDLTAFDLVRACFPAGTVSGAPKVRAVEIISELEKDGRGVYAGMIGYFGFGGNMDTCLAIRTMVGVGNTFSVQGGAGIVADSSSTKEYQETVNKAMAMLTAIDMAENNI